MNKIYKYKSSISKNVCIDELDDIVNKYNHTYYSAIKMKSVDVISRICVDLDKNNNKEALNLILGTI